MSSVFYVRRPFLGTRNFPVLPQVLLRMITGCRLPGSAALIDTRFRFTPPLFGRCRTLPRSPLLRQSVSGWMNMVNLGRGRIGYRRVTAGPLRCR